MKKILKSIALLLTIVMCAAFIAACSSNDAGKSNTNAGDSPGAGSGSPSASTSGSGSAAPPPSTSSAPPVDVFVPPPEESKYADHIDIVLDNNTVNIVNQFSTAGSVNATWTYKMILDTLLRDAGGGKQDPDLATRWETDDFKTFRFWLRDDVYFHNGEKFTANDVLWTIEYAKSEVALGSTPNTYWGQVETATAINDFEVEIVLKGTNVDYLYYITHPSMGIVNKKAMDADPEKGMTIGTGCWKLVGYSTGDYITVERNDDYWGPKAYTKSLTMRYIAEVSTRTIMMQNKECQVCFGIGSEDLYMFEEDTEHYTVFPLTYNNPNTLAFNMNDPICGDYNFRMAISCALIRDEISIVAAGNWAAPTYWGQVWGFGTPYFNPNVPEVVEDLALAKEYLAKSVYKGEVIEICCAVETYIRAAEVIQQQLSAIGINTEINRMEGPALAAHTDRDNSKLQIRCYVSSFAMSPANARNLFYSTARSNVMFYNNARVDEILDQAAITVDEDERRALYYELQEITAADPPVINTFWRLNGMVGVKGIGGMALTSDNFFDLRYIYNVIG